MRIDESPGWRPAVDWLVDAVRHVSNRGDVIRMQAPPGTVSGAELAAIADFHGVPGFARLATPATLPELDLKVHQAQARHLRAISDLSLVAEALDGAGIAFLVAKGPALVVTAYVPPELRSYVDLDILVRPRDLRGTIETLAERGFSLLDSNWPVLTSNQVQELRLEGPTGGAVDLHWSLSPGPGELDTAPPADRLIARAERVAAGSVSFLIPGPADLVVHVAVHAASSGGHRLIWLADLRGSLDYALTKSSPDHLLEVAREWQALPAFSLMARRTHRLLGLDLPRQVTHSWPLRAWAGVDVAACALAPAPLAGEGSSPSRLVARSSRSTLLHSVDAVARKGWNWATTGRPLPPGRDVMQDPTNPLSALYPAGGTDGAEAFYARVAARDRG